MEGDQDQDRYVAQLKAEFDSCDTTATGYLDREELTALCHKLHLEAHLHLLLDTLLGGQPYARVNFEEFKDGFVAVLSRSLDLSTSEEESSYLEPVVHEEVKPKFVKGTKRYGRRSRPDNLPEGGQGTCASETQQRSPSPGAVRRAKLPRSTSLESVESLKSDEDPVQTLTYPANQISPAAGEEEEEKGRGEEVSGVGVLGGEEESAHLGSRQHNTQEVLCRKSADLDGHISLQEVCNVPGPAPISSSTPIRPAHPQREALKVLRSPSPSLLSVTVGQRVLSSLDDGTGSASPERVLALWTEEGIRNSRDILQTLDFPLEERLSLADLSLALDNELLTSRNGIHQAALVSYKNEIQHLLVLAEQACGERDKVKCDLEQADRRNLQLVREVDDRHATMETLNQSKIRDLEQEFRDRLAALRSQSEQESEVLQQQVEVERGGLRKEVELLRVQENRLQEELCSTVQENQSLEEELSVMKRRCGEAEKCISKLQKELDKVGSLDPQSASLVQDDSFSEILTLHQQQCRELQDRNDELSSELELLRNQGPGRKSRRSRGDQSEPVWSRRHSLSAGSDSEDTEVKRGVSPLNRKKLQVSDKTGRASLDSGCAPAVSIETELAMEQLREKHSQELHSLRMELETKVNFYERSLELMRNSMEVERKDISQSFKLEISDLEEEKTRAEEQLKEALEKMEAQVRQHNASKTAAARNPDQERRAQREQAELEQNYAREISNLVQRLSAEKDEMEADLKLKMDQEVMLVRAEVEEQLSQMKRQHAASQRSLLHQLHTERQRAQEQRACWEKRHAHLEQESQKEKLLLAEEAREERTRMCEQLSSERRRLEDQQELQLHRLQEEVRSAQHRQQESSQQISRLEDGLEQQGAALRASHARCSELEAKLQEARAQLEGSVHSGEAHQLLSARLTSEKGLLEEELGALRARERALSERATQLTQQLERVRAQARGALRDKEHAAASLGSELESLRGALRDDAHGHAKLTAELDSLRTDRARLIQDLKEQAMAVDDLRLELDGAGEELDRRRSCEETLREDLRSERAQGSVLRSRLGEERDEAARLNQEKSRYISLVDQLSTQIVEMEEEISTLRGHIRDLSAQLNQTADLVLDLRNQLRAKSARTDRPQQDALEEARAELRRAEEAFEGEKSRMKERLLEMERLVLDLEVLPDQAGPHRCQVELGHAEISALNDRITVLQQEVQRLEENLDKKTKKLDEVEREHEKRREEEEKLHKENSRYREEVLELSGRNLQLSGENGELSSRLRGDEGAMRSLQERLAKVTQDQQEATGKVRQLETEAAEQERERLQRHASWEHDRELLDRELASYKEKSERTSVLEEELASMRLKQQWREQDSEHLLEETQHRNLQVDKLQASVRSLDSELDLLRSQLQAVTQERNGHAQELASQHGKLQEAQNKVEELQASLRQLNQEKEEIRLAHQDHQGQATGAQQEELQNLRLQNQDLLQRLSAVQVQEEELQRLTQECLGLRARQSQLESARTQAQDQAVRSDSSRALLQTQHSQQLQEVREQVEVDSRQQFQHLQARLEAEQRRSLRLEESLRVQVQQASSQLSMKQDQYEKVLAGLQERFDETETKLKSVRLLLQEKAQQLKEQMRKSSKSSKLLQELYLENSQLMKALQVTEQRQKTAERKNFLLEDKVSALNKLLRELVPAALAT